VSVADRRRRTLVPAIVIFAQLLGDSGAAPVAAHAIVMESEPAAGAVLDQPPGRVRIRFNSRIEPGLSRLALIGADRRAVPLPLDNPTPDRLEATLPPLTPGTYGVRWRVLAADGHITEGTIRFVVKPRP
jgi:methionine-rich copper-binding protein CopC